ncbi:MAG: metalloregulator ArsR/SmtB family transcription factor [Minisyncoccia bacterium]
MKEKELEKIFKALANRRRLAILTLLKKKKQANVGEIAEAIKLSFKSTSRHLSVLVSSGILDREQSSLYSVYSFSAEQSEILRKILNVI